MDNSNIIYQKLTEDKIDTFIQMRINQLREEGATEDVDLAPALRDYYVRHMKDGSFVSWIAMDGEKIVGTSGMSFVEKPPYFGCPSGRIGLLSSMFTAPDYRRQGIAKELLSRVVEDARAYGCGVVQITWTGNAPGASRSTIRSTTDMAPLTTINWSIKGNLPRI